MGSKEIARFPTAVTTVVLLMPVRAAYWSCVSRS